MFTFVLGLMVGGLIGLFAMAFLVLETRTGDITNNLQHSHAK